MTKIHLYAFEGERDGKRVKEYSAGQWQNFPSLPELAGRAARDVKTISDLVYEPPRGLERTHRSLTPEEKELFQRRLLRKKPELARASLR